MVWSLTVGRAFTTAAFVGVDFGGELWVGVLLASNGRPDVCSWGVRIWSGVTCVTWEVAAMSSLLLGGLPRFFVGFWSSVQPAVVSE